MATSTIQRLLLAFVHRIVAADCDNFIGDEQQEGTMHHFYVVIRIQVKAVVPYGILLVMKCYYVVILLRHRLLTRRRLHDS